VPYLLFPDIDDDTHNGIGSVDGRERGELLKREGRLGRDERKGGGVGNHTNKLKEEYLDSSCLTSLHLAFISSVPYIPSIPSPLHHLLSLIPYSTLSPYSSPFYSPFPCLSSPLLCSLTSLLPNIIFLSYTLLSTPARPSILTPPLLSHTLLPSPIPSLVFSSGTFYMKPTCVGLTSSRSFTLLNGSR
jgi:hypothetical protein